MSAITDQVSTSIDALTREFDVIAHNLANVSTVGYKRRCNAFSKSLDAQDAETYSPGTIDLNSVFDFSQGSVVETGRPLDIALYGKGFFVIETPDGPLYTRNGTFLTNQNRQIVDSQGRSVAGQAGPITIPDNVGISQLNVSSDGTISAGDIAIGKFRLADFSDDENKLVPTGESCYRMPDETIQPVA
ncbi:MAG: flagellar hook basal-body protein, partial [Phycisphaerales bacterium]